MTSRLNEDGALLLSGGTKNPEEKAVGTGTRESQVSACLMNTGGV